MKNILKNLIKSALVVVLFFYAQTSMANDKLSDVQGSLEEYYYNLLETDLLKNKSSFFIGEVGLGFNNLNKMKKDPDKYREKAIYWLEKAASDDPEMQFILGCTELFEPEFKSYRSQGFAWIKKSAENNNSKAQVSLALNYIQGRGVSRNIVSAYDWAQKAALQKDYAGLKLLEYLDRNYPVRANKSELIALANQGKSDAEYQLGQMYLNGNDVEQDTTKAISWLEKSAKQNYAKAFYSLGNIYNYGSKNIQIDYKRAANYYKQAVQAGDAYAATNLSILYHKGLGVPKNEKKAKELNEIAAKLGDYSAMYNVGLDYSKNTSLPNNYSIASEWFAKSLNTVPSMCAANDLATLYATGKGVEKDEAKANDLYHLATQLIYGETWDLKQIRAMSMAHRNFNMKLSKIFGEYQTAQSKQKDISDEIKKKYSEQIAETIVQMSKKINHDCWQ